MKRTTKNMPEDKHWIWYQMGEEEEGQRKMDGLCKPRRDLSVRQKRKSMTEQAGGKLCLPQGPYN